MRANPTQADPPVDAPSSDELTWRCHPARRQPGKAALVLVVLAGLFVLLALYTTSIPFALVLTLVLFLSLSAFYFPTWYHVSGQGIRVKTLITRFERPWNTYRSHWPDQNGVLLSPFPRKSRLENFRGLFVRFEDNRDEVLAYVRRYVPAPEPEE